jgi:glyoxylase-like metal-dependent hydrolase (beta-lactamase superfamily II)
MTGEPAQLELYQVVIAGKELPLSSCLLRAPADDTVIPFTYSFWVAVDGPRVVLVDTGLGADVAARRGIKLDRTCAAALHELGISTRDVTDIVITHLHFDHTGSLGDFPDARLHVQAADLDFYTGPFMRFALCSSAMEQADLDEVLRARSDGRLSVLTGDAEIAPGLTTHLVGGHTPGMQVVRVRGAQRSVVLASDAAHVYANLERSVPFPVLHDVPHSCLAFERLAELGAQGAAVVPGHDGSVMQAFERLAGPCADYVARLA